MAKRKRKQEPVVKIKPPSKAKNVLGHTTKDLVMVRSSVDPDSRFYVSSEMADDSIIADELVGKMVDKCVYEFPAKGGGEPIRGLTIVGIRESMRLINRNPKSGMKLMLDHSRMFVTEETFNGEKGIMVKCYAVDHVSGAGNWGIKFETFNKHGKNGAYADTFVVEKATSKAIRNAIAGLIPVEVKVRMVDQFAKKGSIAQLPSPKNLPSQPKPPIASIKASTPADFVKMIQGAIEKFNDPEELHKLAEKIEHTPKLSAVQKKVLIGQARAKANQILNATLK